MTRVGLVFMLNEQWLHNNHTNTALVWIFSTLSQNLKLLKAKPRKLSLSQSKVTHRKEDSHPDKNASLELMRLVILVKVAPPGHP